MRPIRKTAFMTWKKCKRKFQYFYFAEDEEYFAFGGLSENKPMRMGSLFHAAAESLYNNFVPFESLEDVRNRLPKDTEVPDKWYDFFAEIEWKRYEEYKEKGWLEHFRPKYIEKKLHLSDTIDRTGHVDRIDYLPDKEALCIVEYKTGKSYDPNRTRNLSDLRAEIGFYQQILNLTEEIKEPVLYWKLINPTLQIVFEEKIPSQSLRAVAKTYRAITEAIQAGGAFEYPRDITLLCRWCPYVNDCLFKENIFDMTELKEYTKQKRKTSN